MKRNLTAFVMWMLCSVLILWGLIVLQVELIDTVSYPWNIPVLLIVTLIACAFILLSGYLLNEWANPHSEKKDVE